MQTINGTTIALVRIIVKMSQIARTVPLPASFPHVLTSGKRPSYTRLTALSTWPASIFSTTLAFIRRPSAFLYRLNNPFTSSLTSIDMYSKPFLTILS